MKIKCSQSSISLYIVLNTIRSFTFSNARAMGDSALFIKQRHVRNCSYADPEYGKGVAKALGIDYEEALKAEDPAHPTWDPRNKK